MLRGKNSQPGEKLGKLRHAWIETLLRSPVAALQNGVGVSPANRTTASASGEGEARVWGHGLFLKDFGNTPPPPATCLAGSVLAAPRLHLLPPAGSGGARTTHAHPGYAAQALSQWLGGTHGPTTRAEGSHPLFEAFLGFQALLAQGCAAGSAAACPSGLTHAPELALPPTPP